MNKNEIKALAQIIARDLATDTTLDDYYNEVVQELGKELSPLLVEADLFTFTSGTAVYDYPLAAVELLNLFFTGYALPRVTEDTLDVYSKTWRSTFGTPSIWTTDRENSRKFRVYPNPDVTSTAIDPLADQPLGDDFPANSGAVIYSDSRESGISDMLGLYITFRILYKEFIRPSDHQDVDWALVLKEVSEMFYVLGTRRRTGTPKKVTAKAEE